MENAQKGNGLCKKREGGVCVKHYHMGMSFNCGRLMSTNTCTWVLFLSGACWLYELNARALCHSLLLSSASVCQRARKVCTQLRTQVRQFDCKRDGGGWCTTGRVDVIKCVYWFQNLSSTGAPGHSPEAWEQCTPAPQCASWGRKCG